MSIEKWPEIILLWNMGNTPGVIFHKGYPANIRTFQNRQIWKAHQTSESDRDDTIAKALCRLWNEIEHATHNYPVLDYRRKPCSKSAQSVEIR